MIFVRFSLLALALGNGCLVAEVPEHLRETRILDFSNPAGMGTTQYGYRITGPGFNSIGLSTGGGPLATNGSIHLSIASTGAPVTLEQADGTSFDLISLDLAEYSIYAIPDVVTFHGIKTDGSLLTFNHVIDRIIDGDGPLEDFEPVQFPPAWKDLARVQVVTTKVALDNIQVRGLRLENFHAALGDSGQLELLTILNGSTNSWGVTGQVAGKLVLRGQRYSYDPVSWMLVDPVTGQIGQTLTQSGTSGGNILTGETALVSGGALTWRLGAQSAILARVGQNGITGISNPVPADGKVLFLNPEYQGHGSYAVFLAGPGGVVPVITPETILPDGRVPGGTPSELHFNGDSYAIPTSTAVSGSIFVVSFAGGPLRLSPKFRDPIPGTNLKIDGRLKFRWIDNSSAGFTVVSNGANDEEFQIVMLPDGSWTASPRNFPAYGARSVLPGWGFVQRHQSAVDFIHDPSRVTYGPIECADLAPNNKFGLVVWTGSGGRHLMIREGWDLAGFGTVGRIQDQAYVQNGWLYVAARTEEGKVGLFRGRIPEVEPQLRATSFIPMSDGTVRFMVENLTHSRDYQVEKSPTPAGPWTPASRFTAGSPARSLLGSYQYGSSGFFRVFEVE